MKNIKAFTLFESGRFTDALKLSVHSIKLKKHEIHETPYEQCKLMIATWMNLAGRKKEAYEEVIGLMKLGLDSAEIRNTLLTILGDATKPCDVPLIFGLGTGRSGSTTLTAALSSIQNSYFSHEHPTIIPWQNGHLIVEWHLRRLRALMPYYSVVGDVSHWWLPYIGKIHEAYPRALFIVLRRNRQQTINSFLKIKGGGGKGSINHWINHDGTFFIKNFWDSCYPKYSEICSLAHALDHYWCQYYTEALKVQSELPHNVLIVDLEDVNKEGLISDFISQHAKLSVANIKFGKKNVGGIEDGINYYPTPKFLSLSH